MLKTPGVMNVEPLLRTRIETDALLQKTRGSIKRRLETERRAIELERRLGEAWTHRSAGRTGEALDLLQDLRKDASSLASEHGHFMEEVGILERKLALPWACREVERILAEAAGHCDGGKISVAAPLLDEAKDRLMELSDEETGDLYEEFFRLHDRCQPVRRPALDRFNLLRESINARITARVADLSRLSGSGIPLSADVLRNLLDQVSLAQGILAALDPALIGLRHHEGTSRELGDLRDVVTGLLHAGAEAPPVRPVPPEQAPPLTEERRVVELSPWAMGSWGTLSG